MIGIMISEEDQKKAKQRRFEHPDVHVQKRLHALYFKSLGYPHKDICLLAGISYTTLETVLKLYADKGFEEVCNVTYYLPHSPLDDHRVTIEEYFRQNPPATITEACKVIKDLTGVERKPTRVRHFLLQLGMRPRKAGVVPGKANPAKQEEFKKKSLEPTLKEAAEGKRHVYFVDAAHFIFGSFLGIVWCFCRQWVSSATGRSRFNVLGALNAVTHHMVTVTNTSYINAWCVVELFRELRKTHLDGPISLILDNARYQRCYIVERAAYMYNIELLYLPPYSPNLNLIERVWKFIKKKALANRSFENFHLFQEAIQDCMKRFSTDYAMELKSLLTWNFQSF